MMELVSTHQKFTQMLLTTGVKFCIEVEIIKGLKVRNVNIVAHHYLVPESQLRLSVLYMVSNRKTVFMKESVHSERKKVIRLGFSQLFSNISRKP